MLVIVLVESAHAQPDQVIYEAETLFDEARALLKMQRYAEACDRFAKSFELGHLVGAELNLGDCAEREGHLAEAWRLFDAAARDWERQEDAERARYARASADRLAAKLGTIVVRLGDPTISGITVRIGERDLPLVHEIRELVEPTDIEVVVTVPGRAPLRQTVHAHAAAIATIDFPPRSVPALESSASRRDLYHGISSGPLVLGGGAIALTGTAFGLWWWSANTYERSQNEINDLKQHDLLRSANRQYHFAQGIGISGAVCAAASVWWYLRSRNQERSVGTTPARVTVRPAFTDEHTGLLIEGWY